MIGPDPANYYRSLQEKDRYSAIYFRITREYADLLLT